MPNVAWIKQRGEVALEIGKMYTHTDSRSAMERKKRRRLAGRLSRNELAMMAPRRALKSC